MTSWYQLAQELIGFFAPLHAAVVVEVNVDDDVAASAEMGPAVGNILGQMSSSSAEKKTNDGRSDDVTTKTMTSQHDLKTLSAAMATASQVLTAKMETVAELDLAPILPSERVVRGLSFIN